MSVDTTRDSTDTIKRRRLLQSLGAIGAAGLAGCSSDGSDGGDNNLGERVPTITLAYWSDMGGEYTKPHQDTSPIIKENLGEFGAEVSIKPMSFSNTVSDVSEDKRSFNLMYFGHSFLPSRLDPNEFMQDYMAHIGGNWSKYINCEFTDLAMNQANATSEDERREMINKGQEMWTKDAAAIPLMNKTLYAGVDNRIELGGVGRLGLHMYNIGWLLLSSVKSGEQTIRVNASAAATERINQTTTTGTMISNQLINSPLAWYNPDAELEGVLAESWEVSDDGKQVTVNLRDNATFHNGDPVTAEDVAWTFNFIFSNPEVYYDQWNIPFAEDDSLEYGAYEIVDDKTLVIHLSEPYVPLVTRSFQRWGILHKDSWVSQGAEANANSFEPDPVIGSGPFELQEHRSSELVALSPSGDHPKFNPGYDVVLTAYQDPASEFQAFSAQELDILQQTAVNYYDQIADLSHAEQVASSPLGILPVYPMCHFGPTKFVEFRKAVGAAINRQQINQLAYRGESDIALDACLYLKGHPWRPPEDRIEKFTDKPSGDIEKAKQLLEDAGWGWDGDGRLHYPPDADLSPLWPKGEGMSNFPCVNADGEYVPPDNR